MPVKKKPPLYGIWSGMRDRCNNPRNRHWDNYGGRGISVCSRWDSFALFEQDMAGRPPDTSLDRIDNDGPYSPENCRWATRKEQARNQRVTRYVTVEGLKYRAVDLANIADVKTDTIVYRAARGMTYEQVINPDKTINYAGLAKGGKANGRRLRALTHCMKGHEFNDKNTYISPEGWRKCKRCKADRQLEYVARKA